MTNKYQLIKEMASDMDFATTEHDLWPDDAKEIAKTLIMLGYRKMPEGSVVLSKEEYEKLKLKIETLRETITWYDNDIKKTSKETARKIFTQLKVLSYVDFDGNICIRKDSFEEVQKKHTEVGNG